MTDPHTTGLCASMGHYICEVVAVYCPHEQHWIVIERAGDDADDELLESRRHDFGPFDTPEEVAQEATNLLRTLVRVTSRVWLAGRKLD